MGNILELRPSSSAIVPHWEVANYTGSDNSVTSETSNAGDSWISGIEGGSHGIAGSEYVRLVRYARKRHVVRMQTSSIEGI